MVIGHEITHAFDDQGWQYDAEGSLQGKARPEWRRKQIQVDPHSPPRFRVLGPVSLMPEFYTAFGRPVPEWVTDRQKEAIW